MSLVILPDQHKRVYQLLEEHVDDDDPVVIELADDLDAIAKARKADALKLTQDTGMRRLGGRAF